jgi:hypothetical protein
MIRPPIVQPGSVSKAVLSESPGPNGNGTVPQDRRASLATGRMHVLTIALEDYFHVTPLQTVVHQDRWYRFEMRLEASTGALWTYSMNVARTLRFLCWVGSPMPHPSWFAKWPTGGTKSPVRDIITAIFVG